MGHPHGSFCTDVAVLFNDVYGVINYAIFGAATTEYIPWLALPPTAFLSIIFADIWKTSSFAALLILAGLQVIPEELYQAARVDGAGVWRRFLHITWPLIRPALLVALLFRTIDAFRVFDLAFVMTQGGPANATNVLQLYGYKKCLWKGGWAMGQPYLYVFSLLYWFLQLYMCAWLGGAY